MAPADMFPGILSFLSLDEKRALNETGRKGESLLTSGLDGRSVGFFLNRWVRALHLWLS